MKNNKCKVLEAKFNSYFDKISSHNPVYLNKRKVIISDVDGIITPGYSFYNETGKIMKVFGAYDTEMIHFMKTQGWDIIFVSKDKLGAKISSKRVEDLGCSFKVADVNERIRIIKEFKANGFITLYVGDSLSDIAIFREADYGATTNNAPEVVKEYCNFSSALNGGFGGFADICMFIHENL